MISQQKTTFLDTIPTLTSRPRIGDKEQWFGIFWQQCEDHIEVHFWSIFPALQRTHKSHKTHTSTNKREGRRWVSCYHYPTFLSQNSDKDKWFSLNFRQQQETLIKCRVGTFQNSDKRPWPPPPARPLQCALNKHQQTKGKGRERGNSVNQVSPQILLSAKWIEGVHGIRP